jgi:C-terminal peptidase prc
LWRIVRDEYLYPDFNGIDWNAIHEEYRQRIETGLTNDEFYLAMDEMIARLGDDHSVFLSPQEAAEEDAEYAGNLDYVGIGVLLSAVPERQRAVILLTFPGSPAEEAGLKPRDSILSVNGEPILDEDGFLRDIVRGPEGTTITLMVQSPGEPAREVTITRRRISGPIPVPYQVLTSPAGLRVGYIFLVTFADSSIDEQVGEALQSMAADAPLDAIIIDNRHNEGGVDNVLRGTLAYFTQGTLGYFISREKERPLEVVGRSIQRSQQIPLVVLIGPDTASYGEVFAGVLKDQERAYLIGEVTEGNIETLWSYDFEDGSRAWIARETFRPYHHPEEDWEVSGIIPHQIVMSNWDEVSQEEDLAIQAALNYFDQR